MPYLFVLIALLFAACSTTPASTSLYKAKGGKQNTPYDDNRENNKELKAHEKKRRARQKEIDQIEHKNLDPSHGSSE